MSDTKYMVYFGFVDNELVYIGKGQDGREQHLNKGRSHVYEANELHFNGGHVSFDKMYVESEEQATKLEEVLIKLYNPVWNKVHTGKRNHVEYTKDVRTSEIQDMVANSLIMLSQSNQELSNTVEDLEAIVSNKDDQIIKLQQVIGDTAEVRAEERYEGMTDKEYAKCLLDRGFKIKEITELIGKSERTIQRWKKEMPS